MAKPTWSPLTHCSTKSLKQSIYKHFGAWSCTTEIHSMLSTHKVTTYSAIIILQQVRKSKQPHHHLQPDLQFKSNNQVIYCLTCGKLMNSYCVWLHPSAQCNEYHAQPLVHSSIISYLLLSNLIHSYLSAKRISSNKLCLMCFTQNWGPSFRVLGASLALGP